MQMQRCAQRLVSGCLAAQLKHIRSINDRGALPNLKLHRSPARHVTAWAASHELDCPHFDICSGCTLEQTDQPPLLAEVEAFAQQLGVKNFTFQVGPPHDWRCRAKLAVRGTPQDPVIGLYRAGTHDAIEIPHCRVQHPRINEAAAAVHACVKKLRILPYNEQTYKGQLRYIQLTAVGTQPNAPVAQDDPSALIQPAAHYPPQVVLVWNAAASDAPPARLQLLAAQLWDRFGPASPRPLVHSIWGNLQASRNNTILGQEWCLLQAVPSDAHGLTYQVLGGAHCAFAPGSFMQANFGMMDAALRTIQSFVPSGSTVLDLHAGVGVIGLSLAATRQARWVRAVEVNPQAQAPFEAAASRLSSATDNRAGFEFTASTAAAAAKAGCFGGVEVVVVDPPRKGLEPELLDVLVSDPAAESGFTTQTLIYLSCGFKSFVRDMQVLLDSGRWACKHFQAFEFFPGTDSVESLAILRHVTEDKTVLGNK